MKKFFSLIATTLMILLMMPTTSSSIKVKAADPAPIVAYGALIKDNGGNYSGLYVVRQSLYKSNATEGVSAFNSVTNANVGLCNSSNHHESWDYVTEYYCDGDGFYGAPASYTLDENGNITIYLENEMEVSKLNIYYLIAGTTTNDHSATSFAYCDNPAGGYKVCEHAKNITSANPAKTGSWKSTAKNNKTMFYDGKNLEAEGFEKSVNIIGTTIYSGYNVIESMDATNKKLAYQHGVYVLVTMSVNHTVENPDYLYNPELSPTLTTTYHINTMLPTSVSFDKVASMTGDASQVNKALSNVFTYSTNTTASDYVYSTRLTSLGSSIDRHIALVGAKPVTNEESEGVSQMLDIIDEYGKPILLIILGAFLLVRGTLLIITIVKSSDEPEVRKDSIKHLVTLFITILIVAVIVWNIRDIVNLISDLIQGI